MIFVGRQKEIREITKVLKKGNNLIVSGKYGIGRTSLIREVADITRDRYRFVFVDFSQPSGKASRDLLAELFPDKKRKQADQYRRYKSSRFLIATSDLKDSRQHVIVLDNIVKISFHRRAFIRYLAMEKRFQFIAITESFLPEKDLFLLRAELIPADVISLHYLSEKDACEFFRDFSKNNELDWTESHIGMLAAATKGYPLGMRETAVRLSERRKCVQTDDNGNIGIS